MSLQLPKHGTIAQRTRAIRILTAVRLLTKLVSQSHNCGQVALAGVSFRSINASHSARLGQLDDLPFASLDFAPVDNLMVGIIPFSIKPDYIIDGTTRHSM